MSLHIPEVDTSVSQPVEQPVPEAVSPTVVAPVATSLDPSSVPSTTVEPAQAPQPCAFTPASYGYYGNSIAHSFGYSPYAPPAPMYPAFMQQPVAPVAPTPPKPSSVATKLLERTSAFHKRLLIEDSDIARNLFRFYQIQLAELNRNHLMDITLSPGTPRDVLQELLDVKHLALIEMVERSLSLYSQIPTVDTSSATSSLVRDSADSLRRLSDSCVPSAAPCVPQPPTPTATVAPPPVAAVAPPLPPFQLDTLSSLVANHEPLSDYQQTAYTPKATKRDTKNRFTTCFKPQAVAILNAWFEKNIEHPYPGKSTCDVLATACDMKPAQIRKWFANKRTRAGGYRRKTQAQLAHYRKCNPEV